ncbi:MAG: SURF1 family cytochrome oxidase biogenesis protein, partial [Candidatus Actinomarina sp.]
MIKKLNNLPNKYLFYFGLFFIIIFLLLAYWQFSSHLERQNINSQLDTRDYIVNTSINNINNLDEYTMVFISDNLTPVRSWLLRSRVNNGSSGYHFITVYLNQSNDYILVNNGWVPLSISFTELINVDVSTLTGRVYE